MPLSMDAKGGGTEADGSLSKEYCSHCYQNGQFTNPNLTMPEMQSAVEGKLKEMGMPDNIRQSAVAQIPQLGRWQN